MSEPGGGVGAEGALGIVIVIFRYPPHHLGGYELRCRDIARELVRRGHRVTVLTSRAGGAGEEDDEGVRVVRGLHLFPDGVSGRAETWRFLLATSRDCALLRRHLRQDADVVAYWHLLGLSSALLAVPRPAGCAVLCDVSSDWLLELAGNGGNWFRIWESRAGSALKRLGKALLRGPAGLLLRAPVRRPAFPPGRPYFTSHDRRDRYAAAGVDVSTAAVIRSGIDLDLFPFAPQRDWGGRITLLFLGRLKRRKGLHTAVLALSQLPEQVALRVVGRPDDPAYLAEVAEIGRATGVMDRIEIADSVAHGDVPGQLTASHVLLFLSEEPEAFSRLVLESFSVGTPVVGTTLGGTGEVLVEGETGLTIVPGHANDLARQVARLLEDGALRARLVQNARELVESSYSLAFTVGEIESLLHGAVSSARTAPEG